MARPVRIAVLVARSEREADGIRDYSAQLAGELRHVGVEAELFERRPAGGWAAINGATWQAENADTAILQYNPFWYGRRGFAPGLVRDVARLRRSARGPRVAMMVHETYVDMKSARWALMGAWQRAQLGALRAVTDMQFCSIESWVERLRRLPGRSPVHHLPVPSNFPDRRAQAPLGREQLGVAPSEFVVSCFALRHPGRLVEHVAAATRAIAASGRRVSVVNLGPGRRSAESWGPGVTLHSPGYLPGETLSLLLAASELFLAPYADGVSTRRTTVMSALQHAVPVLGTEGHLTDRVIREAHGALRLVPISDRDGFATAATELAGDAGARRALGEAGRRLYERSFDWPVVVDALLAVTNGSERR